MNIRPVGEELFHAGGQTNMTKSHFSIFAKAPTTETTSLWHAGIQTRLIHAPIKYQKRDYHTNEVSTDVIQLFDPQKLVSRIQSCYKTVVSRYPLTTKARVRPHDSPTTKDWDRFLSKYFGLPLSVSLNKCSLPTFHSTNVMFP